MYLLFCFVYKYKVAIVIYIHPSFISLFFSISFLNLNAKPFDSIRAEFSKFGEIVRMASGGGGNTDELVSISYADKAAAVHALKTHFTNKDYPYLDIAKGTQLDNFNYG